VIGPHGTGSKESLLNIHLPFVGFTSTLSQNRFSKRNSPKESLVQNVNNYNHVIVNHENNITVIETIDEPVANEVDGPTPGEGAMQKLEVDLQVARSEWSELSAIVGEIRKEKNALSIKLRSKEEEIEQQLEKNNELRQQLRNAERTKRQQLEEIIALQTEIDRERQMRKECES
jgi:chromosome segregation ATPase